jgi:hypothetical protein
MRRQEKARKGKRRQEDAKGGKKMQVGQSVDHTPKTFSQAPLQHVNPLTSAQAVVANDKGVILTRSIHACGF